MPSGLAKVHVCPSSSFLCVSGFQSAISLNFSSGGAAGFSSSNTVPDDQLVLFRGMTMLFWVEPLKLTSPRFGLVNVCPPSEEMARQVQRLMSSLIGPFTLKASSVSVHRQRQQQSARRQQRQQQRASRLRGCASKRT